jgi:hypothetical protein
MERQHLSEISERLIRLDAAQEWRHKEVLTHLELLHQRIYLPSNGNGSVNGSWGPWVKIPIAILLPLLVFLLTLAFTGDPRAALNAVRSAG